MNGFSGAAELPLSFYIDPLAPDRVFTDYEWIWVMITNLLSNAKKYSARGEICTTVHVLKSSGVFRVEVLDDGIGVPDNRKGSLFKPFGQLQKAAGGTGLGLHGVLIKARKLGGRVGIRDNAMSTTGSVFWFEVPFQQALPESGRTLDVSTSSRKEILTKKSGSQLCRILFLGINRNDPRLLDSINYLQERHVDLVFFNHHRNFLDYKASKNTTAVSSKELLEESKRGAGSISEKGSVRKAGELKGETGAGIGWTSMRTSPEVSPKAVMYRRRKTFFGSGKELRKAFRQLTSIAVSSPNHRSQSKQVHKDINLEEGFDAVFWVISTEEWSALDCDQTCSLVEMVKSKAQRDL